MRKLYQAVKYTVVLAGTAFSQSLEITSFPGNGQLTWTNNDTNLFYRIEWAPSLTAPVAWQSDFSSLTDIRSLASIVTNSVPMVYRVCGSSNRVVFASKVPKTGQTNPYVLYDDGWYSMNVGQAWPKPRFTVGTGASYNCVTDNLTGLMWLKNPDTTPKTWPNAITYCEGLDGAGGRGGYSDWRFSNRNELLSLISCDRFSPALPLDHPFQGVMSGTYWSSTTYVNNTDYAWYVDLKDGTVSYAYKPAPTGGYIWPVRGGQ